MSKQEINGVRVVFRDRFSAQYGWDLLGAVRRIDRARTKAVAEAEDSVDFMGIVLEVLSFAEAVTFIRGAVESWDFPGDLSTPECCDDLDPLSELMALTTRSVLLFYTANSREKLSGEVGSGSTSVSED